MITTSKMELNEFPAEMHARGEKCAMSKQRFFLINDGSHFLYTMTELLESKGLTARLTDTAEEALERLSAEFFHLVILKLHGAKYRLALLDMVKELCPRAKLIVMTDQLLCPRMPMRLKLTTTSLCHADPADLWRRIFRCLKDITDKPMPSPAKTGVQCHKPAKFKQNWTLIP